jgi:hypothetical protein
MLLKGLGLKKGSAMMSHEITEMKFNNGRRALVLDTLTYEEFMALSDEARWEFLFSRYSPEKVQRFKRVNEDCPIIYEKFEELALKAATKCIGRYTAADLFGILRWQKRIGSYLKIDMNWIPFYARLFAYKNPEHVLYFNFKK